MKQWPILLVLPLLSACIHEEAEVFSPSELSPSTRTVSFTASFDEETRTSISEGGKVCWNAGDVITYISGKGDYTAYTTSKKYYTITEDCPSASLSLVLRDSDESLVAVYSSGYVNSISSNGAVLYIPEEQTGLFKDAHVSIAKTTDLSDGAHLFFHNVTSLIKFTVERDDIGHVVFHGADFEEICGDIYIVEYNPYNNQIAAASFNEGETRIRVKIDGSGDYYIETLPQEFSHGFTIECFDKDGYSLGCASTNKSLSLARSEIKNIGVIDSRLVKSYSSLSQDETANCYLVSQPGNYKFSCLVQGNSKVPLNGTPAVAEVLWESVGTTDAPSVGAVVNDVIIKDGFVCFTARNDGNAAIAVKDASGSILWSWHIWVCKGYYPTYRDQAYPNGAGTMMDRNLGATNNEHGDSRSYGLLYQWGRKDPFFPVDSYNYTYKIKTTNWSSWKSCTSDTQKGTIDSSIKNPMVFIKSNSLNNDWLYTGNNSHDYSRWNSAKTKYDPCPPGYRVPDGGLYGIWAEAFGGYNEHPSYMLTWDAENKGIDFSSVLGAGVWYPATHSEGASAGVYLSCYSGDFWNFSESGYVYGYTAGPLYEYRSSLRCQKVDATTDLSNGGSANSYIIDKKGRYKIKAVMGNSNQALGEVSQVVLLWDDYIEKEGLDKAGNIGIVSNFGYRDGYVYFQTFGKNGNALIAAKDADENVLWSWHLWCPTSKPADQYYANDAGIMMDRNIGATSATKGDIQSLGLLYQWGRKDPFINSVYRDIGLAAGLQYLFSAVDSDESTGTIEYAVAHPMTFLTNRSDWLYSSSGISPRWAEEKTIYDPCPVGYRVPTGGANGVWSTAAGSVTNIADVNDPPFDKSNYGMNFTKFYPYGGAWYPAVGYKDYKTGSLENVGSCGYYGSTSSEVLQFNTMYNFTYGNTMANAYGRAIRCQKE